MPSYPSTVILKEGLGKKRQSPILLVSYTHSIRQCQQYMNTHAPLAFLLYAILGKISLRAPAMPTVMSDGTRGPFANKVVEGQGGQGDQGFPSPCAVWMGHIVLARTPTHPQGHKREQRKLARDRMTGPRRPPLPPEGTLGYVTCAQAAGSTKRRKRRWDTKMPVGGPQIDAKQWIRSSGTPMADAKLYPADL